jgi:hypothetical protein
VERLVHAYRARRGGLPPTIEAVRAIASRARGSSRSAPIRLGQAPPPTATSPAPGATATA